MGRVETGWKECLQYFKRGDRFWGSMMRLTLFWVKTLELIIKAMALVT